MSINTTRRSFLMGIIGMVGVAIGLTPGRRVYSAASAPPPGGLGRGKGHDSPFLYEAGRTIRHIQSGDGRVIFKRSGSVICCRGGDNWYSMADAEKVTSFIPPSIQGYRRQSIRWEIDRLARRLDFEVCDVEVFPWELGVPGS